MVDILRSMPYSAPAFSIRTTDVFDAWFAGLPDRVARRRIQARIDRLSMGNPGDWKSVGSPSSKCVSTTAPAIASITSGAERYG
jgi:hypothetical protein